jgi:hypothetical protein
VPTLVSLSRRSLVAAVVAGLALAALLTTAPVPTRPAATSVGSYTPVTGATFNRPVGTRAEQRAIFRHVNKTIDSTPAGATIRFAVYSFAEKATTDRLLAAHARGVSVQLIFNKHTIFEQERRLRRALGSNPHARSFVKFCEGSCRGPNGNMHLKVFLFSKAGRAENVVMVGSNNMTRNNAVNQWSDIYTVAGDPALYFTYSGVFEQMKHDVPQSRPFIQADVNGYQPAFYPYPRVRQADDPLTRALSEITCTGAAEGYGTAGATRLRIAQHAWNGERGKYLARQVAALKAAGCDVRVVYGVGAGRVVKGILAAAKIPVRTGKGTGKHTHQKLMTVSGVYAGDPASAIVWNGSHNWSDGALRRDDVVFRIESVEAYDQYLANFADMWRNS